MIDILRLFGIRPESELSIERNRELAEQQLAVFRDPPTQFWREPSSGLASFSEPRWITLQRKHHHGK